MQNPKPALTLIYTPEARFKGLLTTGLWPREHDLLQWYANQFDLDVYSCDSNEQATLVADLPLRYHPVPWLPDRFGLRHAVFYLWLATRALTMRGVIRGVGSDLPVLPIIKALSRCHVVVSFQYDWAEVWRALSRRWGLVANLFQRLTLRSADVVIVTTERLQERCQQLCPGKQTAVIPNFVDIRQFKPQAGRDKVLLYAGRLHHNKGLDILITAFERISSEFPEYCLLIAGAGEEKERMKDIANHLGIASRVEFLGVVSHSQVARLMSEAEVFVYPSRPHQEGHPKSLLEAMACGCACVATDVAGNNDVITSGVDGLLVPPQDVGALAAALRRLLMDPVLRQRLSSAAVKSAQQCSREDVLSQEWQVLTSLVSR